MFSGFRAFFFALLVLAMSLIPGFVAGFILFFIHPDLAFLGGPALAVCGAAGGFYFVGKRIRARGLKFLVLTALYLWLLTAIAVFFLFPPNFTTAHFFYMGDAINMLIAMAAALVLILLASFLGGGLAVRRNRSAGDPGDEAVIRRTFLAMAVPVVLVLVLSGFILQSGMQGQKRYMEYRSERIAKTVIRNLVTAEEHYWAEHETYTDDVRLLVKEYGLQENEEVRVEIIRAGGEAWEARVIALKTGRTFTYRSDAAGGQ